MIVAAAVSGDRDVLDAVRAMIRAQATGECETAQFLAGEECAIGWASTADRCAPFAFARRGAAGNLLVVTGTPFVPGGGLDALLSRALELPAEAAAELLSALEGAFAILHWDSPQRVLSVVTDFFGAQPLHLARAPGAFYCSTALRGLTGAGVVAARPDAGAWGSFFAFGHPLGDRTLVEGAERAPAASILTIRLPGPVERRRAYWAWPHALAARDPGTGPLLEAIERSLEGYREYGHSGAVLMSGGFDSRLVLLSLLRSGIRPRALLVRHRDEAGDADARFGRRAAELAGAQTEVIAPPANFYRSPAYRKYIERSELSTPPLEVFIARVISALKPDVQCVWDGLCIQALRALPGAPTRFSTYLEQPALRARTLLASPAPFHRDWAHAMYEGFVRLLQEEKAKYRDDEHGVAQFALRNRTRLRIAGNPYRVFAVDALPFTPGLTREYYSIVAGLSNHIKGAHRLIQRMYREHFPDALRVPFISGGHLLNLSGRPSWGYTCASLVQALTDNYYALELMRRTGIVPRPAHTSTEQLRALLPALPAGDDCLDESALGVQQLSPVALRRLYYWQVGRQLFRPPAAQPPVRQAAHAA